MEYKEKLILAKKALESGSYDRDTIEYIFPELKEESEDEKIREELTDFIERLSINPHSPKPPKSTLVDCLAWLKKLGEQQPLYIRFGEIPDNEKSKIYRGEEEIGEEDGVSVYPAFEVNGDIVLGLTLPITKTTLYTQQHLLEYENRPCYLVKGDYVGKDTDGQSLINNIQIIKKIDNYRVEEEADDANSYGIKESGSPYPTESATFYDHKSDCEHVGCHINGTKRWCHKMQSEVPYEKCNDRCPGYSSKQKSADKVEPKFQPGDWIVVEDACTAYQIERYVENTNNHKYGYDLANDCGYIDSEYDKYHLWTLDDAKNGDILVSTVTNKPFIYNGNFDDTHVGAYYGINRLGEFMTAYPPYFWAEKKDVRPATKEETKCLFNKMEEIGYEWDAEDKKLNNKYSTMYSKIKNKINNLQTSVQELYVLTDDDKAFLNTVSDLLEENKDKNKKL